MAIGLSTRYSRRPTLLDVAAALSAGVPRRRRTYTIKLLRVLLARLHPDPRPCPHSRPHPRLSSQHHRGWPLIRPSFLVLSCSALPCHALSYALRCYAVLCWPRPVVYCSLHPDEKQNATLFPVSALLDSVLCRALSERQRGCCAWRRTEQYDRQSVVCEAPCRPEMVLHLCKPGKYPHAAFLCTATWGSCIRPRYSYLARCCRTTITSGPGVPQNPPCPPCLLPCPSTHAQAPFPSSPLAPPFAFGRRSLVPVLMPYVLFRAFGWPLAIKPWKRHGGSRFTL